MNKQKTQQQIEWVPIEKVTPYPENAKKHTKKQVDQVAESIRVFGFNQPIVLDKKGVIIVGHGRYEAATEVLNMSEVPTITVDLTEEEAKAYRLADNKLNESDWDMKLVIEELKSISIPMLDLTGFSRDLVIEIDDKDDQIPSTPKVPRSKLGDVYQLGEHRVICGDSTDPKTYETLMGGNKADMVFTDPPYNVNYAGRGKNTSEGILNDHMDFASFELFLSNFFKAAVQVTKGGAGWYIFHSSSSQDTFRKSMNEAGLEDRAQLIWNKPTASMGWGDYRWKHEPFFYAGKKDSKLTFYGDRTNTTVVDFQKSEEQLIAWAKRIKRHELEGRLTVWTMKRDSVNDYDHPTQKPVELITYAIVNSSKEGDIVLDPFLGSGSSIIAAEKTHRSCWGVELDERYVDVIVTRYCEFTNNYDIIRNGEEIRWQEG